MQVGFNQYHDYIHDKRRNKKKIAYKRCVCLMFRAKFRKALNTRVPLSVNYFTEI